MRALAPLALLLALSACGSPRIPVRTIDPDEPDVLPPHEVYLRRPTTITGDEAHVILPRTYEDEVDVSGLSAGWRDVGGKRTWEGSGDCRLEILSLVVSARALNVTLVPVAEEPEVTIQATGNVSYRHSVKGVVNMKDGLDLLMNTNNIVLER